MVKKLTLDNGLRLILAPNSGSLTSTVLVLVEAGSEYEPKEKNGIFHFLEHMCFKRTLNRPKPGMISSELDALGADFNAFTSMEYTGFWAKAEAHKLPNILDIISDMYLNAVFDSEDIERERGVVIEEINMYEDIPMRGVQDLFVETIYGDQPAGRPIHGQKEVIRTVTKDDFAEYRKKYYIAPSTVVVVSGNFDEEKTEADIRRIFGVLPKAEKTSKFNGVFDQKDVVLKAKYKESDQTHLVLGIRAFDIFDERRHALGVLATILGGGMSSRLWNKVREELGAAYYIYSSPDYFTDRGHLEISAGVDHKKLETVLGAILDELKKLRDMKVGEEELNKAKDHMVGKLIIGLETSDQFAEFYGNQEIMTKKIVDTAKLTEEVRSVTAEQIQALAQELFTNDRLNLALIGPYKDTAQFENIVKFN